MPAALAATYAILTLLSAALLLWARHLQDGARVAVIAHADQARLLRARRLYAAGVLLLPLAALAAAVSAARALPVPSATVGACYDAVHTADASPQETEDTSSQASLQPAAAVAAKPSPPEEPAAATPRYRVLMQGDDGLLVRSDPGGAVVGRIPGGSYVKASGLPPRPAEGRLWIEIEGPAGVSGWVAADFLGEAS